MDIKLKMDGRGSNYFYGYCIDNKINFDELSVDEQNDLIIKFYIEMKKEKRNYSVEYDFKAKELEKEFVPIDLVKTLPNDFEYQIKLKSGFSIMYINTKNEISFQANNQGSYYSNLSHMMLRHNEITNNYDGDLICKYIVKVEELVRVTEIVDLNLVKESKKIKALIKLHENVE